MADADRDAGVDPRFDPQFQRGYDPAKHGAPRAPRTRHLAPESPITPTPADATEEHHEPGARELQPAVEELDPPRRNPFRVALLITSAGALAGGIALVWHRLTSDPYYYGIPVNDIGAQFLDYLETTLIPALIVAGMTGLAAWLALGALRRRDT